jgi:hypothetical protein
MLDEATRSIDTLTEARGRDLVARSRVRPAKSSLVAGADRAANEVRLPGKRVS